MAPQGFSARNRVRVEPEDGPAVERLARYIMRPPISLERIGWSGDGEVFYRPKGGHDGCARPPGDPAEAFDPAEFLARDNARSGAPPAPRQVVRGVLERLAGQAPATGRGHRGLPPIQWTARRVRARLGARKGSRTPC